MRLSPATWLRHSRGQPGRRVGARRSGVIYPQCTAFRSSAQQSSAASGKSFPDSPPAGYSVDHPAHDSQPSSSASPEITRLCCSTASKMKCRAMNESGSLNRCASTSIWLRSASVSRMAKIHSLFGCRAGRVDTIGFSIGHAPPFYSHPQRTKPARSDSRKFSVRACHFYNARAQNFSTLCLADSAYHTWIDKHPESSSLRMEDSGSVGNLTGLSVPIISCAKQKAGHLVALHVLQMRLDYQRRTSRLGENWSFR